MKPVTNRLRIEIYHSHQALILFTAVGALMLTVGGMTVANVNHTEAASTYSQKGNQHSHIASNSIKITQTPEYKKLSTTVNLTGYSGEIV